MGFIPRPVTSGGRPAPLPTMAPWGLRRLRCCKASTPHPPATLPCSTFTARISLRVQVCMARFCPRPLLPFTLVFFLCLSSFWFWLSFHYIFTSKTPSFGVHIKEFYKPWRTPASERLSRDALHAGFYFMCSFSYIYFSLWKVFNFPCCRAILCFFARRYIRMHARIASMPKWMTQSLSLPLYLSAHILMHLLREHGMLFLKNLDECRLRHICL